MARKTGSHSDITGPKVRAAALKLFARHGYAAVSMRQIAGEVGVQAGALYLYTPDKQTLLFDLMREHLDDLLAAWEGVEKGTSPLERLESFNRFHISFHLKRPDAVFIAYMELRNLTPDNFSQIERLRKTYENLLIDILEQGQENGVFEVPDTKLAAMGMIAMMNGVNTWFSGDGRLTAVDVEQIYWDMARKSVSG